MTAIYALGKAHIYNARIYHSNVLRVSLARVSSRLFDMIFIDGAKQEYGAYLRHVLPHCAPGAHIVCDDIGMYADKVQDLYAVIAEHHLSYEIVPVEAGDQLLVITLP